MSFQTGVFWASKGAMVYFQLMINIFINVLQVHCLQFLIYEVVSGGNLRKPGGLFGNSGSEIPVNDLKQLETFFYKLSFFLHVLDYSGNFIPDLFGHNSS